MVKERLSVYASDFMRSSASVCVHAWVRGCMRVCVCVHAGRCPDVRVDRT